MSKYKIELKPIKKFGIGNLETDKVRLLRISIDFMSQALRMHESVLSAEVMSDLSILLESDDTKTGIEEELGKLHSAAIVEKLE